MFLRGEKLLTGIGSVLKTWITASNTFQFSRELVWAEKSADRHKRHTMNIVIEKMHLLILPNKSENIWVFNVFNEDEQTVAAADQSERKAKDQTTSFCFSAFSRPRDFGSENSHRCQALHIIWTNYIFNDNSITHFSIKNSFT